MTKIRSARNTASAIEWVMKTMVFLVSSQISWISRFISSRVKASSAPNGSSISSSEGSTESARTIEARCCMPPESSRGILGLEAGEADPAQQAVDPAGSGAGVPDLERQIDVLLQGAPGQEVGLLEHHADLRVAAW